jgi:nicotinamidase-related amidase
MHRALTSSSGRRAVAGMFVGGSAFLRGGSTTGSASGSTVLGRTSSSSFPLPRAYTTLVCDMQEGFKPLIYAWPGIVNRITLLLKCSRLLGLPIVVSEHNPSKLGATVSDIPIDRQHDFVIDKMKFSMCTPAFMDHLQKNCDDKKVILCGIETHICVYQTALELLKDGYHVYIPCDAVSNQRCRLLYISIG